MRVRGVSNLWAVGECAHIVNAYDGQVSSTTGQFAERQGRQAAENIIRVLRGQSTQPFSYRPLGQLCGIGSATRWLKLRVCVCLDFRLGGCGEPCIC